MIPAVRKMFCQEKTVRRAPRNIIEMEALRRELVESIPHTLPYFVGGYHTRMMPAMAGQLAAMANSMTKFRLAKMVAEVPQPKESVRNAAMESPTRNTLRPPSQSAKHSGEGVSR